MSIESSTAHCRPRRSAGNLCVSAVVAAGNGERDHGASRRGNRASIHVELDVPGTPVAGGAPLTQSVAQDISLYGPGDILGIDPAQSSAQNRGRAFRISSRTI